MKKFLAFLLMGIMLVSSLSTVAFADSVPAESASKPENYHSVGRGVPQLYGINTNGDTFDVWLNTEKSLINGDYDTWRIGENYAYQASGSLTAPKFSTGKKVIWAKRVENEDGCMISILPVATGTAYLPIGLYRYSASTKNCILSGMVILKLVVSTDKTTGKLTITAASSGHVIYMKETADPADAKYMSLYNGTYKNKKFSFSAAKIATNISGIKISTLDTLKTKYNLLAAVKGASWTKKTKVDFKSTTYSVLAGQSGISDNKIITIKSLEELKAVIGVKGLAEVPQYDANFFDKNMLLMWETVCSNGANNFSVTDITKCGGSKRMVVTINNDNYELAGVDTFVRYYVFAGIKKADYNDEWIFMNRTNVKTAASSIPFEYHVEGVQGSNMNSYGGIIRDTQELSEYIDVSLVPQYDEDFFENHVLLYTRYGASSAGYSFKVSDVSSRANTITVNAYVYQPEISAAVLSTYHIFVAISNEDYHGENVNFSIGI